MPAAQQPAQPAQVSWRAYQAYAPGRQPAGSIGVRMDVHCAACHSCTAMGNASTMNVHGKIQPIRGSSILTGASMASFSARWNRSVRHCARSEEHTSELQSLMRISYAVFCLKKKKKTTTRYNTYNEQRTQH